MLRLLVGVGVSKLWRGAPAAAAALLLAGTFLPWRATAESTTNGWVTADLLLGLSRTLGDGQMRLVAGGWYLIPFLGLGALLALTALPGVKGWATGLALALSCLGCAIGCSVALHNDRGSNLSAVGPTVVIGAALLLSAYCWVARSSVRSEPLVTERGHA